MSVSFKLVALLAGLSLLAAGCASKPLSDDEIVKQRAEQRWEAIYERDYAKAYEFYSPGYRSKFTAVDLGVKLRLQKVRWTSSEYLDHTCEPRSCIVRFKLGYQVAAPVPGVDVWTGWDSIEETWVKTQGEWWYKPPE